MSRRHRMAGVVAAAACLVMIVGVGSSASAAAPQTLIVASDATWTVDGTGSSAFVTCSDPWGWGGNPAYAPGLPMWDRSCPLTPGPGEHHVFSKSFDVPGTVLSASLSYDIDNTGAASINGQQAGSIPDWYFPVLNMDVTALVHAGTNTVTIDATDLGGIAATILRLTVTYTTSNVVQAKDDCKGGGWANVTRPDGSSFKNQGDCVSYVASRGRSDAH